MHALIDGDNQLDTVPFDGLGLNVGDFDIRKPAVLIKGFDGGAILLNLGRDNASALREEREDVLRLGFHDLFNVTGEHRFVSNNGDALDDEFRSLVDREDDLRAVVAGDILDFILDVNFGVISVLVNFDDFLAVVLDFFFADHIADLRSDLAPDTVHGNLFRPFDQDFLDDRTALQQNRDFHAVTERFGENTHVGNAPGGVKCADILLSGAFAVWLADFCGEVRQHAFLGNTRGADVLDRDVLDDWPRSRLGVERMQEQGKNHRHKNRLELETKRTAKSHGLGGNRSVLPRRGTNWMPKASGKVKKRLHCYSRSVPSQWRSVSCHFSLEVVLSRATLMSSNSGSLECTGTAMKTF